MAKTSGGIYLLKKSKRGLVRAIFSRTGLIFTLLLLQFFVIFLGMVLFNDLVSYFWAGNYLFSVIAFLALVNSQVDPSAKLTWIVVILLFPLFGTVLFWYTKSDFGHRTLKKRYEKQLDLTRNALTTSQEVTSKLSTEVAELISLSRYLEKSGCHPVFNKTQTTYFSSGESQWEAILAELEKAETYIFLEYFIVEEGTMWGKILEILTQKAANGVDVRLIYDGTCEFTTLPHSYPKQLKALGIATKMFAPVTPFASTHYNYRDHRKILVIDGKVGFTGGSNLADEYINLIQKHGHWKDSAIMLKGEAVKSLSLLFLQMWNLNEADPQYEPYLSTPTYQSIKDDGYVIPFGDFPLDAYHTCEMVYIDILNRAERYVHIMTPYLILDGALETAIKFAAERGVDVTLILPGIPDKKAPYALARTHYASLMKAGVKIHEYTPGFVHAKVFVSDDIRGVVGTVNLDYRSLYHHFECAVYLYQTNCLKDIETDFQKTLLQSEEVTLKTYRQTKKGYYLLGLLLKILAPLL